MILYFTDKNKMTTDDVQAYEYVYALAGLGPKKTSSTKRP